MNDLWKIIAYIIGGVGGLGAVFALTVKLCANIIANNLKKKYELELNERFEKYKASVENKKHITKVRFDAEFLIYRDLSKAFFEMVKSINVLIPSGLSKHPADEDVREKVDKENYNNALEAVVEAQDALNHNAPFIPEVFYNQYEEIRGLGILQLNDFEELWDVSISGTSEEKKQLPRDAYNRTREINDKFQKLNADIREYLESLDVLE